MTTNEKSTALKNADSLTLAEEAVMLLLEKQGIAVKMFEVKEHTSITDYYVNATGKSLTHVASLADDLAESFGERGLLPLRTEGKRGNSWILVDFGDLIVNIFDKEARSFYNLDKHLPAECERGIEELVRRVDEKLGVRYEVES